MAEAEPAAPRFRREPPTFRRVAVRRVEALSPRMRRLTFGGPELEGLAVDLPAASVRLLVPPPAASELVMPAWNGNEFLMADGRRPLLRTFTPRYLRPHALELDLDVVLHDGGAIAAWANRADVGSEAAISGPGRGYVVDTQAPRFLLVGDESAIPAMSQLLEVLPRQTPVEVIIEVARPDARIALPAHPGATVAWHDLVPGATHGSAMVAPMTAADTPTGTAIWVAGEAAAVQRIRRHLFEDRGLTRSQATVRGYWKHGRAGDAGND